MNQSEYSVIPSPAFSLPSNPLNAVWVQSNYHSSNQTVFYYFPCGYPKVLVTSSDICYWRIKSLKNKTTNNENKD